MNPNLRISEFPNLRRLASTYRDLDVYKKAFETSLDIHRLTLDFPKIEQYGGMADQMRRASKGICANLAEGHARQQSSKAEFRRFTLIALGSSQEMQVWIEYGLSLDYIDPETASGLIDAYDHITKMLQSLLRKS
ncbi:MAG: four helix bundle protein [Alphaproteobacteria bacterium]|nr:four helix bundle protein [Alphaproteobacteria bacterium]